MNKLLANIGPWLVAVLVVGCASQAPAPVVERATGTPASPASPGQPLIPGQPVVSTAADDTDIQVQALPSELPPDATPVPAPASLARPLPEEPPAQPSMASAPAAGAATPSSTGVNPAVVALLNQANSQASADDHQGAAATLERAVQIEPDNAWLWHRLADERLALGQLEQAAGLAAKSSSLAAGNFALQADNWRLIEQVRRRQGDSAGAQAAAARASALSNQ